MPASRVGLLRESGGDSRHITMTPASPGTTPPPPPVAGSMRRGSLEGVPGMLVRLQIVGRTWGFRSGRVWLVILLQPVGCADEVADALLLQRLVLQAGKFGGNPLRCPHFLGRSSIGGPVGAEQLADGAVTAPRIAPPAGLDASRSEAVGGVVILLCRLPLALRGGELGSFGKQELAGCLELGHGSSRIGR